MMATGDVPVWVFMFHLYLLVLVAGWTCAWYAGFVFCALSYVFVEVFVVSFIGPVGAVSADLCVFVFVYVVCVLFYI